MRFHLGVLAVTFAALLMTAGCHRPGTDDGKAKACRTFAGGKLNATWTQCPDMVRREVSCAPFVDSLKCDCLEDGAQKWFFNAKDPPLATREDATRVANANCHWSLE
jgi:hypothetical protein